MKKTNVAKKEIKKVGNLSMKIVTRFMKDQELDKFMNRYHGAKKTTAGRNRADNLNQPVSEFEKSAVDFCFNNTDEAMKVFAGIAKKPLSQVVAAVTRGSKKILYQNMEKLGHVIK